MRADRWVNSSLSNWGPRSVTTSRGTPKRLTQVSMKASAILAASVRISGMASIQRVARSMHVRM